MKKFGLRLMLWLVAFSLVCGYFVLPQPVQAATVQEGVTLHCWNWSFKSIEDHMATIARMGYTAKKT